MTTFRKATRSGAKPPRPKKTRPTGPAPDGKTQVARTGHDQPHHNTYCPTALLVLVDDIPRINPLEIVLDYPQDDGTVPDNYVEAPKMVHNHGKKEALADTSMVGAMVFEPVAEGGPYSLTLHRGTTNAVRFFEDLSCAHVLEHDDGFNRDVGYARRLDFDAADEPPLPHDPELRPRFTPFHELREGEKE
jgi:hypothetical protein